MSLTDFFEYSTTEKILIGDVFEQLHNIPDNSVQCVITSPPYFGLRSYLSDSSPDKHLELGQEKIHDCLGWATKNLCNECFVCHLVNLFREVKRVLHNTGTVFLNLGDTYAGSWGNYGGQNRGAGKQREIGSGSTAHQKAYDNKEKWRPPSSFSLPGLKPTDLIGIPWRVAFALQADGWYLRNDIIWAKGISGEACKHGWSGSCLPESVKNRFAKTHEYVFLLAKNKEYFFDHEAVKEQNIQGGFRNRRTVWTYNNRGYKGAHVATYPESIPEVCILAGTSEKGCCPTCLTPYIREVEVTGKEINPAMLNAGSNKDGNYYGEATKEYEAHKAQNASDTKRRILDSMSKIKTFTWKPNCSCEVKPAIPCTVLDPFAGSGTTLAVAKRLGRSSLGIELNPDYASLIKERISL